MAIKSVPGMEKGGKVYQHDFGDFGRFCGSHDSTIINGRFLTILRRFFCIERGILDALDGIAVDDGD